MEQHLATEPDGELEQKSPDSAVTPAVIEPASTQPVQNTNPATAEPAVADGVDSSSHEAVAVPPDMQPVAEYEEGLPAPAAEETLHADFASTIDSAEPLAPRAEEPASAASFVEESETRVSPPPPTIEETTREAAIEETVLTVPELEQSSVPLIESAVAATDVSAAPPAAQLHESRATDPRPAEQPHPGPAVPTASFLEQWQKNEFMRHIPPIAWIVAKVDGDVRKRLEMFLPIFESLPSADPRHRGAEEAMLAVCRSLDRLAEASRRTRSVLHPPNEITFRIPWSVNTAVSVLKNTDSNTFGRRQPFQTFDRSGAESVFAALVVVLQRIDAAATILREVDPSVDEKLYGPLVQLVDPLPTAPMA